MKKRKQRLEKKKIKQKIIKLASRRNGKKKRKAKSQGG